VLPDSCILLDYMLQKSAKLIDTLVVSPERMLANLDLSHRLVFSERALLALIDKGMLREDAYRVVQESAMRAWQEGLDFGTLLKQNEAARAVLSDDEIDAALDPSRHSGGRDLIFARLERLSF
jgi:adenylosuccinate lyase